MPKKKTAIRFFGVALSLLIAISAGRLWKGLPVSAAEESVSAVSSKDSTERKYRDYKKDFEDKESPLDRIEIAAAENYSSVDGTDIAVGECKDRNKVLLWKSNNGSVTWPFAVKKAGNYCFRFTYYSLSENAMNVELSLLLDGKKPFFESGQLVFPKCFHSVSEIKQDSNGNDMRPSQVYCEEWITSSADDASGVYDTPYSYYLTEGTHQITLEGSIASVAIESLEFYNDSPLPTYKEYVENASAQNGGYAATYEAETPLYQSSSVIYPTYDRTSIDTSPSDPVKLKYNTIGQSNYSSHGQYIVWEVEVPQEGYYYLGARVRQNINTGMNSYRRLYINGQVPFQEANLVKFRFSNRWQDYVFGEDTPWLLHLNQGKNQIKLEVVSGEMTEVLYQLEDLVSEANDLYCEMIMITGASPDIYRDYHINKEIGGFETRVKSMQEKADAVLNLVLKMGNDTTGNFSAITKFQMILADFLKKPGEIPANISTYNSYCSGISSLMLSIKSQPLELDTLRVADSVAALKTEKHGFFGNVLFQIKAFIGSFTEDYNSVGNQQKNVDKEIEVWINLGREQANVLKSMADSLFTPKYNVGVNISLVQQSLVQAALSGMSPDVVLFVESGEPVNLAMRDGLVPLNQFEEFDSVVARFQNHVMDSYYFNGDYYAIPITQSFPMMFYRTDILKKMNIEPPKTWDEMYKVIRILEHSNLSVGIPNAASNNVMAVDTGIFASLMYQRGGTFYADDFKTTNLDSEIGIEAFNMWTEFYKEYGLPHSFDFFNRFRSGDMPIGLSAYTFYGMLKQSAPEIDGLWDMTLIPGTVDENGKINRSVCAASSCAVMMKGGKHQKEAWKFIDWFTDTEAQTVYGQEMEAVLGPSGRFTPANKEALSKLSWSYREQQLIYTQWKDTFALPQIPGTYIVDRNLVNAFRKVVFSSANPRETIVSYNNTIELEIARKRKEFDLD